MLGVTDNYLVPFALALGASVQQIGWVSGLPNLLGAVSQFFASHAVHWNGGRLKLSVRMASAQAVLLFSIALLALIDFPYQVEVLLLLLVLFAVSATIAAPAWGSLMTEYIPRQKRGQYFSWRNRIIGIVNVCSMIVAGLLLYWAKELSVSGFFIIFLIGALARLVSAWFISRMSDVRRKRDPASEFSFLMFVSRFRESNFVKFVAFVSALTFATHLAGPFFAVFMLRDLQFSYLTYMVIQVLSTVAGLAALPLWGRHADLVGNVRVLRVASFMVTLTPALWLVSHHVLYLSLVQMVAGIGWSGIGLCASNFIYDAVTPQKRIRCIGYFNVINGMALFLGASLGGFAASRLPPLYGYSLLSLFALSSVCRLFFYLVLFRRFREVRPAREVSFQELFFSVVGIRPLIGIPRD
jgi:MFS family permease